MASTTSSQTSRSTSTNKSVQKAAGKVAKNTKKNFKNYNKAYTPSQQVTQYQQMANNFNNQNWLNQNYDYAKYKNMADQGLDRINNYGPFSFDVNESALYQSMKDQYSALGKLAMQDTMGQASAMTGGYANSYAQTAGQQQYQNYLQELNEQLPSIYGMEYQQYSDQLQNLYNQTNLANSMYGQGRADMVADRDFYTNRYSDERAFDYGQYADNRSYWNNEYWNERNAKQISTSKNKSVDKSTSTSVSSGGGGGGRRSSGSKKNASSGNGGSEYQGSQDLTYWESQIASIGTAEGRQKYIRSLAGNPDFTEDDINYLYDFAGNLKTNSTPKTTRGRK